MRTNARRPPHLHNYEIDLPVRTGRQQQGGHGHDVPGHHQQQEEEVQVQHPVGPVQQVGLHGQPVQQGGAPPAPDLQDQPVLDDEVGDAEPEGGDEILLLPPRSNPPVPPPPQVPEGSASWESIHKLGVWE